MCEVEEVLWDLKGKIGGDFVCVMFVCNGGMIFNVYGFVNILIEGLVIIGFIYFIGIFDFLVYVGVLKDYCFDFKVVVNCEVEWFFGKDGIILVDFDCSDKVLIVW